MSWETVASGLFASFPMQIDGEARVVAGLKEILAFMREPEGDQSIIVTNVAGGSAVSTIIRRAKAIISTIGGPNSHIVIVARDYNVPCIVGAAGLDLAALAAGTRMRMCADGSVQLWREAAAAPTDAQMRVLRNVAFAGAVSGADGLVGLGPDLSLSLSALATAGLIEIEGLIAPTQAGLDALDTWYAGDRAALDAARVDAMHAEFRPLDVRVKRVAAAWQDADARNNWDSRMSAIEALAAVHAEAMSYIDRHEKFVPRLDEYRKRLTLAIERVMNGDTNYVVKVTLDSYHTIWFQFHEDLLRLLRKERDPE